MQTVFNERKEIAFEGMLADSSMRTVVSKYAEGAGLEFGLGVTLGTDKEKQRKALSLVADIFAGVIVHEHTEEGAQPADKEGISVLEQGKIYVKVEEAVAPGDPVFVRAVAEGAERAGAFRKSQDATDCIDLSAYAKWDSVAGADGLAVLHINLP